MGQDHDQRDGPTQDTSRETVRTVLTPKGMKQSGGRVEEKQKKVPGLCFEYDTVVHYVGRSPGYDLTVVVSVVLTSGTFSSLSVSAPRSHPRLTGKNKTSRTLFTYHLPTAYKFKYTHHH